MSREVLANEASAAKRRVYFDCRDVLDGMTEELGEAGGQPQISTNGGAWTNVGIGTLTAIGNGRYYADLTLAAVGTPGEVIETRYKSAATAETPGDTIRVVAFNADDAAALGLSRLDANVSSRNAVTPPTVAELNARTILAAEYATAAACSETRLAQLDAANLPQLLTRLSNARAGYLDNLNLGGLAASQADVQGITQAQRVRVVLPMSLERPDAGNLAYRIWIYAYNELHQAEDLDVVPVVTAENNAAVDRSAGLGVVTKPAATTGVYYVDYTVASADAIEGLIVKVTATEGGVATEYAAATLVVDTTAVDFTAADRAKLDEMHDNRLTAGRAANLDELGAANIPSDVDQLLVRLSAGRAANLDNLAGHVPQTGDSFLRLGAPAGASIAADLAAVLAAIGALNDPTAAAVALAVKDAVVELEGNYTIGQVLSAMFSVLAGITAGSTFKTPNGLAARVVATLNASQERTAMAVTPSA